MTVLPTAGSAVAGDSTITEIREDCSQVDEELPSLGSIGMELFDYSSEGGMATAFMDCANDLLLMKVAT